MGVIKISHHMVKKKLWVAKAGCGVLEIIFATEGSPGSP